MILLAQEEETEKEIMTIEEAGVEVIERREVPLMVHLEEAAEEMAILSI